MLFRVHLWARGLKCANKRGNNYRKGDFLGFSYKEQFAVVVICKDEKEQETVYNRLKEEGLKLKVVSV